MKKLLLRTAEHLKKHRRSMRVRVAGGLGCIMVICTVYALILPAAALTNDNPQCGLEEHAHNTSCYAPKAFSCTVGHDVHRHVDTCYDANRKLTCGYADYVIHTHDAQCYNGDTLICTLKELHTHGEECRDKNGKLVCTLDAVEKHTHTNACYHGEKLICGKQEIQPHTHTDKCRDKKGNLICGKLEIRAHQHTQDCVSAIKLTCTKKVHAHDEDCYAATDTDDPVDDPVPLELPEKQVYTAYDAGTTEADANVKFTVEMPAGVTFVYKGENEDTPVQEGTMLVLKAQRYQDGTGGFHYETHKNLAAAYAKGLNGGNHVLNDVQFWRIYFVDGGGKEVHANIPNGQSAKVTVDYRKADGALKNNADTDRTLVIDRKRVDTAQPGEIKDADCLRTDDTGIQKNGTAYETITYYVDGKANNWGNLVALCALTTTKPDTKPDTTITQENEPPTIVNEVQEGANCGETNDGAIGDTVNFRTTITAQAGAQNYVLRDTMSAGLTFTGITGVTLNGTIVDAANYTVVTEHLADGRTFEVWFTKAFCDALKKDNTVVITYSATINENAIVNSIGNSNKVYLDYGDASKLSHTPEDVTTTYTWTFGVFTFAKTANGSTEVETPLAGAKFTVSTNSNGSKPIALIAKGNNVYRIAKAGETGTVTVIATDSTGKFTIYGLDSGTYYLTETQNPDGYNRLNGPVAVTIDNRGTISVDGVTVAEVKVENKAGTRLPSTGGMGTTLFYITGGILVIGTGALLVTKKRMNAGK